MAKQWTIRPASPDAGPLAQALGIPPIAAQVLAGRDLADPDRARAFLKPDLSQLHEPAALPAFLEAADRLVAAARDGEPIVVYGDYDADGITASAILWRALRLADANVRVYVPNRIEEGYGLNVDAVERLAAEGTRVLVTVDCGITSIVEVARARALGMDVIITDHHEPSPSGVPEANVLIDPKLPDSPYPFRELAGAGVALKLAWALGQRLSTRERVSDPFREFLVAATGLAALGTIADVVPLVGENHALARFGLTALAASQHPGIRAILEVAGLSEEERLDADHVGFMLGPRLNAAGRLGQAQQAVELLTSAGPEAAMTIAKDLDRQNRRRQEVEKEILTQAEALLAAQPAAERDIAIVLAGAGWHPGVIGIVASRLTEKYGRPTILLALTDGKAQGSGRSIAGFHLFQALATCREHLTTYGGHKMAAGLRMPEAQVPAFREAFLAHAAGVLTPEDLVPRLTVDAEVTLADLSLEAAHVIKRMGPFGAGNPRPVFATPCLRLASPPKRMGRRGDHLSMHLSEGGRAFRAVGWRMGEMTDAVGRAGSCGVAFTCQISEFRGPPEIELHLKDLWIGRYGDTQAAAEYA